MMSSVGAGGPRATASSGTIFIGLKPFSDRNKSAFEVVQELRPQLAQIPGIKVYLNVPPSIRIGGSVSKAEYQYTLQDLDLQTLYASAIRLTEAMWPTTWISLPLRSMSRSTVAVLRPWA
jgi:HAE1 family hydrophobic/amphiphilic exporter-1